MKILFIQLPLLDHSHSYVQGNVEYAPAVIAAFLHCKLKLDVQIELLPFIITNFGSNDLILRYVFALQPTLICFTNYAWNVERHLSLAQHIKSHMPHVCIIFGGPEIAPGSFVFSEKHPEVDYFVNGEGEWFFRLFFGGSRFDRFSENMNGTMLITQPAGELIAASEIVEPFTSHYLNAMPDGSVFLEMTRGCPYRCDYCYYSKNSHAVRELPFHILLNAFQRHSSGLREIYILSPTFNRTKHFHDILRALHRANPGIRLHTEMRADTIDAPTASLLRTAGFASLEIGLQTLTPEALANINRHADPYQELEGMKHLRDAGIDLKIGIIPGLPGDTPQDFMKTVETLVAHDFARFIELYPLMILPGTRMRDTADKKMVSYLQKPPYYFLHGWGFNEQDIAAFSSVLEEMTGYCATQNFLPDFSLSEKGWISAALQIMCERLPLWHEINISRHIETAVFSFFLFLEGGLFPYEKLFAFLRRLPQEDQLYSLIFFSEQIIDEHKIINNIYNMTEDTYHSRLHYFDAEKKKSIFRFFQVFCDYASYVRARDSYSLITPIIKISGSNMKDIHQVSGELDYVLVGKDSYKAIRSTLVRKFFEYHESAAFELHEDMEDFYHALQKDYYRIEGFKLTTLG